MGGVGYSGLFQGLNAPFPRSPVDLAAVWHLNLHSFVQKVPDALQHCLPV